MRCQTTWLGALLASALAAGAARAGPDVDSTLVWPLEFPTRSLSASFMEPRGGRFHAGIDLRTGGRTGIPVMAPAAGWISRVRASPLGYGKALYLTTAQGTTYVFAHLSAFASRLQAELTHAQRVAGSYEQDLSFPAGRLPVARGERIALSGDTGSGAPHLHFEVRNVAEVALNPLLNGFTVPDPTTPRIRGVRVVALAADARLAGALGPVTLAPGDSVDAIGRLGVQVDVTDQAGAFGHALTPLGLRLRLDDRTVYALEQLECSFPQSTLIREELDLQPGARSTTWMRLYRREGNSLPHRQETVPGASLQLTADGRSHPLTVVAWDAAGNRDSVNVVLRAAAPIPAPRASGASGAAAARSAPWELQLLPREALLEVRALAPRGAGSDWVGNGSPALPPVELWLAERPRGGDARLDATLLPRGQGLVGAVGVARLHSGPVRAELRDRTSGATLAAQSLLLGVAGTRFGELHDSASAWAVRDSSARGLDEGGFLQWMAPPEPVALPPGTRALAKSRMLMATGVVFRGPIEVSVGVAGEAARAPGAGICLLDPDGGWTWLTTRRQRDAQGGARLCASLDAPGVLAALVDDQRPLLRRWEVAGKAVTNSSVKLPPRRGPSVEGITLPRWTALELPLSDAASGVAPDGISAALDGKPFPARYDPEAQRLSFEFYDDPGPGVHTVQVTVRDRAGNSAQSSVRVSLSPLR